MLRGAFICVLSLMAANFLVSWLHDDPDYAIALMRSFDQFVAIFVYQILWVKEEK